MLEPLESRRLLTAILPGDANADGRVDADDYFNIDRGYAHRSVGYQNGDFDGSGSINADDFFIIDSDAGKTNADVVGPHGTLAAMNGLTITTNGAAYDHKKFLTPVAVSANDVSFHDCSFTITANAAYAIKQNSGFTGLLLEDCEVTGSQVDTGVVFYGGSVLRTNIHHLGGDALKPRGPSLVEGCWIHELGMEDGSHADGVQIRTSDGSAIADIHLIDNYFDMPTAVSQGVIVRPEFEPYGSNACVFVECPTPGFLAEGNDFNGGNYCVGIGSGAGAVYQNNDFMRDFNWGLRWSSLSDKWLTAWGAGNVWWDNGAAAA